MEEDGQGWRDSEDQTHMGTTGWEMIRQSTEAVMRHLTAEIEEKKLVGQGCVSAIENQPRVQSDARGSVRCWVWLMAEYLSNMDKALDYISNTTDRWMDGDRWTGG